MPNAKRQTPNLLKPANVTRTNAQAFKNLGRAEGGFIHPLSNLRGWINLTYGTDQWF